MNRTQAKEELNRWFSNGYHKDGLPRTQLDLALEIALYSIDYMEENNIYPTIRKEKRYGFYNK